MGTAGVITTCTACHAYGTEPVDLAVHDAMEQKTDSTTMHMTYLQAVRNAIANAKPVTS